ncbi:MAG TPA: carboxypeptidase regulatory-like domain-containing protein [Gemmatimonadaceae bacterium]|nr:carboxypeptidase regulatory-like domain-containing protein [Gemmatimonadaceae bacterium]
MNFRRIAEPALLVLALAATARVQQPPTIAGRVITPAGAPVGGADVRVEGTDASTRTDERGAFRFAGAPKGIQTLLFRRIGYLPASLAVRVPESSDTLTVMMVPSRSMLDTVQVRASLNVLAGVVIDSANRTVPGAKVEMIGTTSASTSTDSTGWFTFTSVHSGPVVLRIRKLGYQPAMHSMQLADWRGVVVRLSPLDAGMSESKRAEKSGFGNRTEWVWTETRDRMVRRGMLATVVPREELAPFGDLSLGQAIRRTRSGMLAAMDLQQPGNDVCVLIDGNRMVGSTNLDTFRANEVDFVELYPPGTETSGTVRGYLRGAGCRSLRFGGARGRGPYYAVVWLRA